MFSFKNKRNEDTPEAISGRVAAVTGVIMGRANNATAQHDYSNDAIAGVGPTSRTNGDWPISFSEEADMSMDSNENLQSAYPFAAAEMDIDMIERARTAPTGATSPKGPASNNPVEIARQVAAVVQDLVRRLDEDAAKRKQLEQRLASYEESARAYESVKQTLREVAASPVNDDDLETMEKVLHAMAQDPNHIMVLASVAQQSANLQAVVASFRRLRRTLQQGPPR